VHDDKRSGRPQRRDSRYCTADWGETPRKQTIHQHGSVRFFFPEYVTENCSLDFDWKSAFSETLCQMGSKKPQAVDFFDTGIQKLVTWYKCLDSAGD
jgi:hypothetical protein